MRRIYLLDTLAIALALLSLLGFALSGWHGPVAWIVCVLDVLVALWMTWHLWRWRKGAR